MKAKMVLRITAFAWTHRYLIFALCRYALRGTPHTACVRTRCCYMPVHAYVFVPRYRHHRRCCHMPLLCAPLPRVQQHRLAAIAPLRTRFALCASLMRIASFCAVRRYDYRQLNQW